MSGADRFHGREGIYDEDDSARRPRAFDGKEFLVYSRQIHGFPTSLSTPFAFLQSLIALQFAAGFQMLLLHMKKNGSQELSGDDIKQEDVHISLDAAVVHPYHHDSPHKFHG